jgi:hypothetical protein
MCAVAGLGNASFTSKETPWPSGGKLHLVHRRIVYLVHMVLAHLGFCNKLYVIVCNACRYMNVNQFPPPSVASPPFSPSHLATPLPSGQHTGKLPHTGPTELPVAIAYIFLSVRANSVHESCSANKLDALES